MGMFRSEDLPTLLRNSPPGLAGAIGQQMTRAHRAKPVSVWIPLKTVNAMNLHEHWSARAKRAKRERAEVSRYLNFAAVPTPPVVVTMTRFGRVMDDDGLASATKHVQDAIATWLGVDDGDRANVRWVRRQVLWTGSPAVHVTIRQRRGKGGGPCLSPNAASRTARKDGCCSGVTTGNHFSSPMTACSGLVAKHKKWWRMDIETL